MNLIRYITGKFYFAEKHAIVGKTLSEIISNCLEAVLWAIDIMHPIEFIKTT